MPKPLSPPVKEMLARGVRERVFPGGVLALFQDGELYLEAFGWQEYLPRPCRTEMDTYYDLASLTKPLATTLCLMRLVAEGKIALDDTLARFFLVPYWLAPITLAQLLSHQAGLVPHRPYFARLITYPFEERKKLIITWILKEPLAYPPGLKTRYSDLGFILLGEIIRQVSGQELDTYFAETLRLLGSNPKDLLFTPKKHSLPVDKIAATEFCPWRGKLIKGEVHDENAWVLGGVAGHAGLFGHAQGVLALLIKLLLAYHGEEEKGFLTREVVRTFWDWGQEGDRALGFDRPSGESSSAGRFFSKKALGHLGFTGPSFWLEPEKRLIVVLLTNRVHPSREPNKLKAFRPALHDLLFKELGLLAVKN